MFELQLITTGAYAAALTDYLTELGALAITLSDAEDNPIFEPEPDTIPLWPTIKLAALFSAEQLLEEILLQLYIHMEGVPIHQVEKKIIPTEDWIKKTQALTQPQCFGDTLWVYPSWHAVPDGTGAKVLLDPGIAFGTGSHATTALMLKWLAQHPPVGLAVLDYGCGSGILGIAASKLGATTVWCTDIDPQALAATNDNAQKNQIVTGALATYLPETLPAILKTDILLANILAMPLIQLMPKFIHYLKPAGLLVLSGILEQQLPLLTATYEQDFVLQQTNIQDGWASMVWQLK